MSEEDGGGQGPITRPAFVFGDRPLEEDACSDEGPAWQRLCSPYDPSGLDDGTTRVVDELHKDIDRLDGECVHIIQGTMGPLTPATDALLIKQTELAAAIGEREVLLEEARCERVVKEFEELHPPQTEECPICFEAKRSFSIVSFPCCGKIACETCADPERMACCPFCRGEVDEEEGAREIERLAEKGNARAMRSLGVRAMQRGDTVEGMEWFDKAFDNGLGAAADSLATIHQQMGDEDIARSYLEKAAQSGYTPSQFKLAVSAMETMNRYKRDAETFIKYTTIAASQEFPMAQLVLAKQFSLDDDDANAVSGLPKSLDRSKYWLTKAIQSAYSDPRFDVGEARIGLAKTAIDHAEETYRLRHNVHGTRFLDFPGCSPFPLASVLVRLPGSGSAAKQFLTATIEPMICDHCACCENPISKAKQKGNNKKKGKNKQKGKRSCPHCQGAYYCGKECLKNHWDKGHAKDCKEACALRNVRSR